LLCETYGRSESHDDAAASAATREHNYHFANTLSVVRLMKQDTGNEQQASSPAAL
jgi:hypothetical protein